MPITDLTGYTWVGNDNLTEDINASFYISFISNSTNFTSIDFYLGRYFDGVYYHGGEYGIELAYTIDFDDNRYWTNEAYKTITITGGTDATNSTLIAWLEENGTLTAPQPQPTGTNNIWLGTTKLAKAFVGNTEIASMWLGNVKIYEKGSSYDYSYDNETLTIENAPYNYSDGVLTIE